jgi:hypothetical protein
MWLSARVRGVSGSMTLPKVFYSKSRLSQNSEMLQNSIVMDMLLF